MTQPIKYTDELTEKQQRFLACSTRKPVTIGYIRISPAGQDIKTAMQEMSKFAEDNGWPIYIVAKERLSGMTGWKTRQILKSLTDRLKPGDRLIVQDFSNLGRSIADVINLIAFLHKKDIAVYDIKNKWTLNNCIETQTILMFCKMADQIDRALISMRVKEGLAIRKAKGLPLGRKKGVGRSKLDKHKNEIIDLLKTGSTKAYIMKRFGTSKTNLYNWLSRNKLDRITPVYLTENSRQGK
jgi:DNA invertase Pin-like site-specific DNA recombinase